MAEGVKIAARNQKAFHEYFIDEKFEAGIELTGTEVKSIRLGTLSLKEAWCQIKDGQLVIRQMHIAPYEQGNIFNKDPLRPRRLLMHKREIMRLYGKVKQDGYALIPLSVYFRGSLVKVEVALARGKKLYDKRDDAAESLTAGGDIQRRASVAPDQLGSLFAADDLHQFFTLFLPTQRDAERNGKTCPALGPDELDRRRKANQFNQFIHALPPCPGLPGKHLRRRAAPLPILRHVFHMNPY